jgi:acyl-CoA thioesterase
MTEPHPFDAAVALDRRGDVAHGRTSPLWRNFIGPFGGLTAAQMMNAVLTHPARIGDPVSITVNFAAAIDDGEFEVLATPARTNRSTQHWIVTMSQQGRVVTTATVLTAIRRETWNTSETAVPDVPRPDDIANPGTPPRMEWVKRYDLRFIEGRFPTTLDGSDSGRSLTRQWVRDNPPRPLDWLSLTAKSDIFFPRILLRRATPTPLGTITMTTNFIATARELAETGTGWLLGQVEGQGFRAGYFDHTAQLWNEAGTLLATTSQVYYFKE